MGRILLPDFPVKEQEKIVHITYDGRGVRIQILRTNDNKIQSHESLPITNQEELIAYKNTIHEFLFRKLGQQMYQSAFDHVWKLLEEKFS